MSVIGLSHNILKHDGKQIPWKEAVLSQTLSLIQEDLKALCADLEVKYKVFEMQASQKDGRWPGLSVEENKSKLLQLRTLKKESLKLVKMRELSNLLDLEDHFNLIKCAFDVKNYTSFQELLSMAFVRCEFRRIEHPYITDIDFEISDTPKHAVNVEKGYERIQININEASLRQDIRNYRNKGNKTKKKVDDESRQSPKKGQKKPKKGDNKGQNTVDEQEMITEAEFRYTKEELENVSHQFVYLKVKRSYLKQGAIFDIKIKVADEVIGPLAEDLPDFKEWICKAIPIKQYIGVQATYHTVPYLCFKKSANALTRGEENQTLLIDLMPLISLKPHVRPPPKYLKMETDLRQVPKEFLKMSNIEYMFITIRQDTHFENMRRLIELLDKVYILEKSTGGQLKITSEVQEAQNKLDANFSFESLSNLIEVFQDSLEGPNGENFLITHFDFLNTLSFHLWTSFISPVLIQIEQFCYMKMIGEVDETFQRFFQPLIEDRFKPAAKRGIRIFLKVASSNEESIDVLWISKMSLQLAKMLEEAAEFKESCQILRNCYQKIVDYRDEKILLRIESKNELLLPFCITCSNPKISNMLSKIGDKYFTWKMNLERKIRRVKRTKMRKHEFAPEEEDEEEDEVFRFAKQFFKDGLKDEEFFKNIEMTRISELDMVINCIQVDVLINMVRCEIKLGDLSKTAKQHKADVIRSLGADEIDLIKKQQNLEGIADNLIKKINLMREKGSTEIKKTVKQLDHNLRNNNTLGDNEIRYADYEKKLKSEANQNPYFKSVLYMVMAMDRTQIADHEKLLQTSFDSIRQCETIEERYMAEGVENTPELISTLFDSKLDRHGNMGVHPFSAMNKEEYLQNEKRPGKPSLICKTSSLMVFKLPAYKPRIDERIALENPMKMRIESMSLFGRRDNSTEVSTSSNGLSNTGVRFPPSALVTVPNLAVNEHYSFAVAAYDAEENISNTVGRTLGGINTSQPLPINLLYCYLAKIAFQMGQTDIALEAAKAGCLYVIESTGIKERILDFDGSPALAYRVKADVIQEISCLEMRSTSETLVVWANCQLEALEKKMDRKNAQNSNLIDKEKELLRICNLMLLGIELAVPAQAFDIGKNILFELFNILQSFLFQKTLSKLLLQILIKAHMLITLIPKNYWDNNLRMVSAKLSYQVIRLAIREDEFLLSKRLLYSDIRVPRRSWLVTPKVIMVEKTEDPKAAGKSKAKAKKKGANKKEVSQVEEVAPKKVEKFVREISEEKSYQDHFEEFLLSMHEDYYNFVDYFIEHWNEYLINMKEIVGEADPISQKLQTMNKSIEFYSLFFDINNMPQKLQEKELENPQFLEHICKFVKQIMEMDSEPRKIYKQFKHIGLRPSPESKKGAKGGKKEVEEDATELGSVEEMYETPSLKDHEFAVQLTNFKLKSYATELAWNPAGLQVLISNDALMKNGHHNTITMYKAYFEEQEKVLNLISENWPKFRNQNVWACELFMLKAQSLLMVVQSDMEEELNNFKLGKDGEESQKNAKQQKNTKKNNKSQKDKDDEHALDEEVVEDIIPPSKRYSTTTSPCNINELNLQLILKENPSLIDEDLSVGVESMIGAEHNQSMASSGNQSSHSISLKSVNIRESLEEIRQENSSPHKRLQEIDRIFRYLGLSSSFAFAGRSWRQLQNIVSFALNVIIDEGLRPEEAAENEDSSIEIWAQLALIVENVLKMVQDIKESEGFFDNDEANYFGSGSVSENYIKIDENESGNFSDGLEPIQEKKNFWFANMKELKISQISDLIAFLLRVLVLKGKYALLISVAKQFSNLTSHYYSAQILPFLLFGLSILHKRAKNATKVKVDEFQKLREEFDSWMQVNKSKVSKKFVFKNDKSRKELEYDENSTKLKRQIEMFRFVENNLLAERDTTKAIIAEIKSESRQALESLKDCKYMLARHTEHEKMLEGALLEGRITNQQYQALRRSQTSEGVHLAKKLVSTVTKLRAKAEILHTTIALHDLGDLYFSMGLEYTTKMRESWEEALGNVFQNIHALSNFRDILGSQDRSSVKKYGTSNLMHSLIILDKLSTYCYYDDSHKQRETFLMASSVAFSIFRVSLTHPQNLRALGSYKLRELSEEEVFEIRRNLDINDLLLSLINLAYLGLDYSESLKTLPILVLAEYLAESFCFSSFFSTKAKIMKAIVLGQTGQINEAIYHFLQVFHSKDLPIKSFKNSEQVKLISGSSFSFGKSMQYFNDITPYDDRNIEIVKTLQKDFMMDNSKAMETQIGISNLNLFRIAKATIILSICKQENLEKLEYSLTRSSILRRVEKEVQDELKYLDMQEKLFHLRQSKSKHFLREDDDILPERMEAKESDILKVFEHFEVEDSEMQKFYMSYEEDHYNYWDMRTERSRAINLSFVLLVQLTQIQNQIPESYEYLRKALATTKALAYENCQAIIVDKGIEVKDIEEEGGKDKGGKKAGKKASKKDKKDKKGGVSNGKGGIDQEGAEMSLVLASLEMDEKSRAVNNNSHTNRGLRVPFWLTLKSLLAKALFKMLRYEDLADFLEVFEKDCRQVSDKFFLRKGKELQAKMFIRQGYREKGQKLFKEIIQTGNKLNHDDNDYIILLADYAELLSTRKDYNGALELLQKARSLLQAKIRLQIDEFELKNMNAVNDNVIIFSELFENKYDIEQKLGSERIEKGNNKGGAGGKNTSKEDKKGKNESSYSHVSSGLFQVPDNTNYLQDVVLNEIALKEQTQNNNAQHVNIYDQSIELIVKTNLRIAEILLLVHRPDPNNPNFLEDIESLNKIYQHIDKLLEEIYFLVRKDFFINSNLKACNEYMKGKLKLQKAQVVFLERQSLIIRKHLNEKKNRITSNILKNLPLHDVSRNKYILKVPTFSKFLREDFIPLVEEAKELFTRAMNFLKGESLIQEYTFSLEEMFYEISQVNLLLAEYRPRVQYILVTNDDIRQFGRVHQKKKQELQDKTIYEDIEKEASQDKSKQIFLLW